MNTSAYHIEVSALLLIFIPLSLVIILYFKWALPVKTLLYATARMLTQLICVGYALIVIFNQEDVWVSSGILGVMLTAAGWIALRPIKQLRKELYSRSLGAIVLGSVPVLAVVIFGVVRLDPWYLPRYLIPLAGMIFANSMNSVSLCAERFFAEIQQGRDYTKARNAAYQTGLLPILNSFFAVGLVSMPGMMTGQILSGVSPLLAVRYQIMVMCMIFSACGISSAIFLYFFKKMPLK